MSKKPTIGDLIAAKHDEGKLYLVCGETSTFDYTSFTLFRLKDQTRIWTPYFHEKQMLTYFEILASSE
jgi:hypothetical protein